MNTKNNSSIKIVRLQSGEDIITEYNDDDDIIHLNNPMSLFFKRTEEGNVMMLVPWLPVELIKNNSASIYYTDIVTVLDPEPELQEYYKNAINIDIVRLKQSGKLFLKYLTSKVESVVQSLADVDEIESEEEDFEFEEMIKPTSNNTYH